MGRAMRKVSAHLSFNRQFPQKQKFFKRTSAIYVCALGTGIKGSDLSQVYILVSIFIFSVCMSVQDCTHCGDWGQLSGVISLLMLCGTQGPSSGWQACVQARVPKQVTLLAPKLSFFFQDLIVFTCFQIIFMSNVAVYNLPRPFWSQMWLLKKRDYQIITLPTVRFQSSEHHKYLPVHIFSSKSKEQSPVSRLLKGVK